MLQSAISPDSAPPAAAASAPAQAGAALPLQGEEQARADLYALLARLLYRAPDAALLAALAAADPICAGQGDHALETAWERLVLGAGVVEPEVVDDEFNALFVSTGNPKINPYGSFYLSGSLYDKPLAELRAELGRLQLARAPGAGESEDHLAALFETMRVLIGGAPAIGRRPLAVQKQFFLTHLASWYPACLADIAAASEANFYRLVADFARAFLAIEAEAFAAWDDGADSPDSRGNIHGTQ
ncbi:MAG TPA: molecular chaperone TorD family protein [Telluria sp.]